MSIEPSGEDEAVRSEFGERFSEPEPEPAPEPAGSLIEFVEVEDTADILESLEIANIPAPEVRDFERQAAKRLYDELAIAPEALRSEVEHVLLQVASMLSVMSNFDEKQFRAPGGDELRIAMKRLYDELAIALGVVAR